MHTILRLPAFVLIGVLTAAIGEFQYSVLLRDDWANWFGSMFFNALYLSAAFVVVTFICRRASRRMAMLLCVVLAGLAGLAVEWFAIGNSPWGNPDASQIGMAAYWACLVVVPLILIIPDPQLHPLKRAIFRYGLVYTAAVLLGDRLVTSPDWRFAFHVWTVVFGYLGLGALCVLGY